MPVPKPADSELFGENEEAGQRHSVCQSNKRGGSRMEKEIERRCLPGIELRYDDSGDSPKITGYAAVFDQWTDIGGMFREKVAPGAFKKTIKEADVRALWNHDPNFVLGRNKSGTLKMREDENGLAVEIDPPRSTWSNDLITSMKRGDINQMSFGFTVNKADDDYNASTRILRDVTLFDVSVVTYPAYPTTTAKVRSAYKKADPDWIDELAASLRAKEELTQDQIKSVRKFFPSEPVENHSDAEEEPVENHSDAETRKKTLDKTKMLLAKADNLVMAHGG